MLQISYTDLYEASVYEGPDEDIQPGDLVRTGANLYPHFQVVAVNNGTAWVRDVQTGRDGLTNVSRCRRINGPV
ncbi:MAG TPA: hypothetical protein VF559_06995 [Caulobacteraceae bacterium]